MVLDLRTEPSLETAVSAIGGGPGLVHQGRPTGKSAARSLERHPRSAFGWNDRHGTRWKIACIPLGGYVKFLGDSDASSATPSDHPLSNEQRKSIEATEEARISAAIAFAEASKFPEDSEVFNHVFVS